MSTHTSQSQTIIPALSAGLVTALLEIIVSFSLAVLVFGFGLIAYFPKFVLGGLLILLGIAILTEWVYDGWFKMPCQDYVIMLIILAIITLFGYLEGVGFGMVAAAALFAFDYSRLGNIQQTMNGQIYQSKINRPHRIRQELRAKGDRLVIYRLHGVIFFGSANDLLEQITEHIQPSQQFLLLDFQQVQSVDSSAILTFIRLCQQVSKQAITLVFCGMSDTIEATFARSEFDLTPREEFQRFAELDEAVEWCEDQLLNADAITLSAIPVTIQAQLAALFPDGLCPERMVTYMKRREIEAGTYVARQGERADALYWIESGRLRAYIESDTHQQRVRIAQAGTVLGELGLYTHSVRSASIVADADSVVYVLTQDALQTMEKDDPAIAADFHKMIARLVSERLADTTTSLEHYL